MGLKEDLKIDKYALDEEWLRQPDLFLYWAEQVVEAQTERDRLKEKLDVIKAELDSDVRSSPEKHGLSKVTEGAVQNIILTEGSVRDANSKFLDALKTVRMLEVGREAMEHRKKALEALTQLYLNGYYLTDSTKLKGDVKDYVEKSVQKQMKDDLNSSPRLQKIKRFKDGG